MARNDARYGPTPEDIKDALDGVLNILGDELPPIGVVKTLEDARISGPVKVHDREVVDWQITPGSPEHGELRSDDHISKWVVEYHGEEVCHNCESTRVRFDYLANHHISGRYSKECAFCGKIHEEEYWG